MQENPVFSIAWRGREAAIVSTRAGTTRDVVEVRLDLGGWPLTLADTAGLRESRDEIESEGVRRALDRAASADLSLVVFDGARWPEADAQSVALLGEDALAVLNKTDLLPDPSPAAIAGHPALGVSCLTGAGIERCWRRWRRRSRGAIRRAGRPRSPAPGTGTRWWNAATRSRAPSRGPADERLAEELRLAAHALGRITGRVDVEAVLDLVFRDFCIGK